MVDTMVDTSIKCRKTNNFKNPCVVSIETKRYLGALITLNKHELTIPRKICILGIAL